MQGTDRIIMLAVPVVALLAAFWFLVITPKQDEVSALDDQIESLSSSIDANEAEIAAAEQARESFPKDYTRLVELGRAVPEDSDQATFVYEISELGRKNDLLFQDFEVLAGSDSNRESSPTPRPVDSGEAPAETGSTPALATEAAAAVLPIGATVGPAGLPVMPHGVAFRGNFFKVADFLADLDATVGTKGRKPEVTGRLMTIDSFVFTGDPATGFPEIQADLALTTYLVTPEQGATAGATPAGPAATDSPGDPVPVAAAASVTP